MADAVRESRTATLRVTAPEIHIYPFSKLVGAPAARWERLLREIEAKEQLIYRYYQPVREAAVKLTAQGPHRRDAIFAEMTHRAEDVIHGPKQDPVKDNQARFAVFGERFFPRIKEFKSSLLRVPQVNGTPFAGLILKGLPHMVVTDMRDRERFVYLYPSSWDDADRDAYLELLTIIIESQFGASATDLWCMGLKDGKTVPWSRSRTRTRNACYEAALHYKRMLGHQ
jgi:hypothetical protein